MKQMLMVLALVAGLAAPAAAQSFGYSTVTEGTTSLAAKAVTNVNHDLVNQVMSFSLTLLNNSTIVVNMKYGTPPAGQILSVDWINPQVAELIRMAADKKRTDAGNFYYFYMNPVKWKKNLLGVTQYWVMYSTVVTLDAVIPYVPKAATGSNTRGGLVRAVISHAGRRSVTDGVNTVNFTSYGYVTLKRVDGATDVQFDAHLLREDLVLADGRTLRSLSPRAGLTYDATKFMSDVLAARQLVILSSPLAAYKIGDTRIVYDGCLWTTDLNY